MIETLKRICALQPQYAPTNTPPMQERGALIRQALKREVAEMAPALRKALGAFGHDFGIGASDGIGRKTEAPWLRLFSESMSPTPREGFYVVFHFAADGSAVFVTLGCAATTWAEGELTPLSDEELHNKTQWARELIANQFGSLEPFTDQIALGARAPLPRAFEKATAFAKKLTAETLQEDEVRALLISATERLAFIYDAQRVGRDLSALDLARLELEKISRPGKIRSGQGFGLSQAERVAVEGRAMQLARSWLENAGYVVTDTSKTSSFDFEAVQGGERLKVEVKGTTAASMDTLFMTKNEVALHQSEKGKTALLAVASITLARSEATIIAGGGVLSAMVPWDIDLWEAVPIAYQLRKKS